MKAIETKGRLFSNGIIQIDEPINAPAGEVRLVILYPEAASQTRPKKLSPAQRKRIVSIMDSVAALSSKKGPPVSNRNHDQYLYGKGK
jgi:hypothetical protein